MSQGPLSIYFDNLGPITFRQIGGNYRAEFYFWGTVKANEHNLSFSPKEEPVVGQREIKIFDLVPEGQGFTIANEKNRSKVEMRLLPSQG